MALSPRMTAAILAQETEDSDICLITMTHPAWTAPVRLSTHATTWLRNDEASGEPLYGTVSRGDEYLYVPMQASMPNSADEQPPEGKLVLSNVNRIVSPYLKMVDTSYPRITLEIVNTATPDIVEAAWPELDLSLGTWDASTAEVSVINNIASNEPMPWLRFGPAYFPNLF